ncbi:MAG TPA: chromosome segregation protein SMC [Acidimicrobiales bacterium]|nr:chromosome segregation protein SMC [Acidimicrobiales bacterium]
MFLRSLTLKGFKSFAEPTTLDLEPGVTVVVGPNGSGKSNIVDAVAWVLGAQGPRTVRSSRMDDVIFAGSANKPALGRAEVTLTIDNSAGLLPIDFTELTITRTLFRSGDSEYAINGVPCRLLDVQELLSDTGVGRQQHVIVSQGQLAGVLDARPEDRRLIIEEAAGVLKYRRRREKAERRLEATEANLVRLQDLLREVRRQRRPLERQADAARRHGAVVDELRDLKLHLAGRELVALDARRRAAVARRTELAATEAKLRAFITGIDAEIAAAEGVVTVRSGEDPSDGLVRFEGLRERVRGVAAVLTERRRSVDRELQSAVDADVVASLEAEAAALAAALEAVDTEAAALAPRADELAASDAALAAERAAFEQEWGDGDRPPAARAAELRGELGALRRTVEQATSEQERLAQRLGAAGERAAALAADAAAVAGEVDALKDTSGRLAPALAAARERRAVAEAALASAEATLRNAEQARHSWAARAEALGSAFDEARARAGAERLAGVAGVVGTLVELVDIDEGWEDAFEAAAGEAVAAVVVDGVGAARTALAALRDGSDVDATVGAAVLALGGGRAPASAALHTAAGEPVRAHVASRHPGVEALLDTLLADAVAVEGGWERALDLALSDPGLVVVTRQGDRFATAGWRVGCSGTVATRAALAEAEAQAAIAEAEAGEAAAAARAARSALADAQRVEADLVRRVDANEERLAAATTALDRRRADLADAEVERDALSEHLGQLADRRQASQARVAELESLLPGLERDEAAGIERLAAARATRARLAERATALAALRTDLEVRFGALEERRAMLASRRAEVADRLQRSGGTPEVAGARMAALERRAVTLARLASGVAGQLHLVETGLARLHEHRRLHREALREAVAHLDGLRSQRAGTERRLTEVADEARRAELEASEVALRLETAVEALRRELGVDPLAATAAPCRPLPDGVSASDRAAALERDLRTMGPVNPLALEELHELEGRQRFVEEQLDDVRSGRRELAKVIAAVDAEIASSFAAAYADVAAAFSDLVALLFPGGSGQLRLTDPDNLLETGIEVEARPSGKSVRKLSLLSGGERSLVALAFLFAVFRSRPSPFYLLDEVEAALDDVNLHRFVGLIEEFRNDAQLLVVTHQKRTMEAADCLYGVSMAPGGSSKVLSERMRAGT